MTDINEPADGGYVAVDLDGGDYAIYRRRDDIAARNNLGDARWFRQTDPDAQPLTWYGVTILGPVAYVGAFVDRSEVSA